MIFFFYVCCAGQLHQDVQVHAPDVRPAEPVRAVSAPCQLLLPLPADPPADPDHLLAHAHHHRRPAHLRALHHRHQGRLRWLGPSSLLFFFFFNIIAEHGGPIIGPHWCPCLVREGKQINNLNGIGCVYIPEWLQISAPNEVFFWQQSWAEFPAPCPRWSQKSEVTSRVSKGSSEFWWPLMDLWPCFLPRCVLGKMS